MSGSCFKFKQFSIWHDRCAMKVGTDGVLLGAWSRVASAKRMLDVGTGSGLVALMMAQRSSGLITALEIEANAVAQAKENVSKSPWAERMEVVHTDFRQYHSENKFDVIVSNPPYFINSLECPELDRTLARHTGELTYYDLLQGVSSLLSEQGEFTVILPSDVVDEFKKIARGFRLYPCRQLNVITTPNKLPKRNLITCSFKDQLPCAVENMLIEEKRHQYSEEYIALTKEFYLNM